MKKPTQKGGGRHRDADEHNADKLDADDRALWRHAAQTVAPLTRRKGRHHPAFERELEARGKGDAAATSAKAAKASEAKTAKPKPHDRHAASPPPAKKAAGAPPAIALFERKKARKIRSGQLEIEARIDLHGLRQDEAHAELVRFLFRCHGRGQRWVLVITGKGRKNATDDDAYTPFDMTAERNRGVLKRNVPRWLDEPELRAIVVSYTTASIGHGGEGALYVHLRKRRQA